MLEALIAGVRDVAALSVNLPVDAHRRGMTAPTSLHQDVRPVSRDAA
jgi:hypothetical protein